MCSAWGPGLPALRGQHTPSDVCVTVALTDKRRDRDGKPHSLHSVRGREFKNCQLYCTLVWCDKVTAHVSLQLHHVQLAFQSPHTVGYGLDVRYGLDMGELLHFNTITGIDTGDTDI